MLRYYPPPKHIVGPVSLWQWAKYKISVKLLVWRLKRLMKR